MKNMLIYIKVKTNKFQYRKEEDLSKNYQKYKLFLHKQSILRRNLINVRMNNVYTMILWQLILLKLVKW